MREIKVNAVWDKDAQVWVATSDDVPGLITEAETAELLEQKLCVMIPELLIENGAISCNDRKEIPFYLCAERHSLAKAC